MARTDTGTRQNILDLALVPFAVIVLVSLFLQYANWLFVIIIGAFIAQSNLIKRHPLIFDIFWFVTLFLVILDTALALRVAVEGLYFTHSISKALLAISSSMHTRLIPLGWLPKILAYLFMAIMGTLAVYNRYFPLKEDDSPRTLSGWYRNYLIISFVAIAVAIAILAPIYYPTKG